MPRGSRINKPLVAVNGVLLATLAALTLAPHAIGSQPFARARGEYLVMGVDRGMGSANAIVVVDTVNEEMIVLGWTDSTKNLAGLGYRDLKTDGTATLER